MQALETIREMTDINGYVWMLDHLPVIRSDLVRNGNNWQEWDYPQLVDTLRKCTERSLEVRSDRKENSSHGSTCNKKEE